MAPRQSPPHSRDLKPDPKKHAATFGELIAAVYEACGRQKAKGIVWLAVNARLIKFRGQRRLEISGAESRQMSSSGERTL
jgi:hypothetical protein